MSKLIQFKEQIDLTDYTLIIPSVSVGNVPQLTIDLLITNLNLRSVATIWHPGLICSVSADPFNSASTTCTTACELYINEEMKLATVQIRSSIEIKLVIKFLNDLEQMISDLKFCRVILLATAFDYELHNINDRMKLHLACNFENCIDGSLNDVDVKNLPEISAEAVHPIAGAGIIVRLYKLLQDHINCILLVRYISEGDNITEAKDLLFILYKLIDGNKTEATTENEETLKLPTSWKYIFGRPAPSAIF